MFGSCSSLSRRMAAVLTLGIACSLPLHAEPLTLGKAVLLAVRNHPDLRVAQAQWESSLASRDIATDRYWPSINGSVGYNYSEAQSAAAGGQALIRPGFTRQYRLGVTLDQMLLDFGKTKSAVEAAQQNANATEIEVGGKLQDLVLNVATQYFTVLREQQNVLINEDNVRNAEAQLVRAQGFYSAGTRAKIEVTQAESTLANAELLLIQARNAELKARANLNTAVGDKEFKDYVLREVMVSSPPITQERALQLAHDLRPDIKAQEARIKASRANVDNSRAQYWPTISASAGYSWADKFFLPQPYNWNVGVNLAVPIFNEPLLSATVRQSEAGYRQSLAVLDQVVLAARQQVVEGWLNLKEAEQRIKTSLIALAAAQENFRLASERYQVGVGGSLDVSDAQRLLVQARSQELQARFDKQTAVVKLHRVVGDLTVDLMLGAYPAGDLQGAPRVPSPPPQGPPAPTP